MHQGTKIYPGAIAPRGICLLCDVNCRRPDDDFMALALLLEQPFKILKHGAVPVDHVFRIRSEIPADPPLRRRDHLLSLQPSLAVGGFIGSGSTIHSRETGFY